MRLVSRCLHFKSQHANESRRRVPDEKVVDIAADRRLQVILESRRRRMTGSRHEYKTVPDLSISI